MAWPVSTAVASRQGARARRRCTAGRRSRGGAGNRSWLANLSPFNLVSSVSIIVTDDQRRQVVFAGKELTWRQAWIAPTVTSTSRSSWSTPTGCWPARPTARPPSAPTTQSRPPARPPAVGASQQIRRDAGGDELARRRGPGDLAELRAPRDEIKPVFAAESAAAAVAVLDPLLRDAAIPARLTAEDGAVRWDW